MYRKGEEIEITPSFSEFYDSEETRKVFAEALKVKAESRKNLFIALGCLASTLVFFILALGANVTWLSILLWILVVGSGVVGIFVFMPKAFAYDKYYKTTFINYIGEYIPVEIVSHRDKMYDSKRNYKVKKDRRRPDGYSWTPLEYLKRSNNVTSSEVFKYKLGEDAGHVEGWFGRFQAVQKEKNSQGKVETDWEAKGLFFNVQADLPLESEIRIMYEAGGLSRLAEATLKAMKTSKKEFDFNNSVIEERFDCRIYPDALSSSGVVDNVFDTVGSLLKGKNVDETNISDLWDNKDIYELELEKLQTIITEDVELFMEFVYNNFGPFNLIVNKTGIYMEILDPQIVARDNFSLNLILDVIPGAKTLHTIYRKFFATKSYGKSARSHDETYVDESLLTNKDLGYFHVHNLMEIMRMPWLLYKYFGCAGQNTAVKAVSRQYEDDHHWFEDINNMKHDSVKVINEEYEHVLEHAIEQMKEEKAS